MQHPFLRRYRAIVAICVGVVLLLPAILDRPNYEKHVSATQWQTDGAFVANGQPDPRDFPARVCGHRMHGSGEIIPRKEGARPTAICRLRLAHEPRDHTGSGFPELGRRRRNLSRVGNRSSTILDSRGRSAPRMTTVYAFSSQIPNEQGSPTDRLFQEYARVYIGVGTPLAARR